MVVWLIRFETLGFADESRFVGWLEPHERAKHGRFRTQPLKDQYLLTRALSRWLLTHHFPDHAPSSWRFERTGDDRPFVVGPITPDASFDFNLTNSLGPTDGVVAAVSSTQGPVGIDVEPLASAPRILDIVTRIFTPRERAELERHPDPNRRAVELWTLKEAYLKALGTGISEHLDTLEIGDAQAASPYRFDLLTIPEYVIAVTRARASTSALRITPVSPADLIA